MANESDTLKSFLVRLGFVVDTATFGKFATAVSTATKNVAELAAGIEATATAVAAGVTVFSKKMEDLYYSSVRTKTSAGNITAYRFAISKLGGTAEQASQSIENLAEFIRSTPAAESYLASMGIQMRDASGRTREMTDILEEFGTKSKEWPFYLAKLRAGFMGIDESMLLILQRGGIKEMQKQYEELAKSWGYSADELAKGAVEYQNSIRDIKAQLNIFMSIVQNTLVKRFAPQIKQFFNWFQQNGPRAIERTVDAIEKLLVIAVRLGEWAMKLLDFLVKLDEATGGWSTKLIALAAVLKLIGAFEIASLLLNIGKALFALPAATAAASTGLGTAATALGATNMAASMLLITLQTIAGVLGAGALGYWLGGKLNDKITDALGGKSLGETIYDKLHPEGADPTGRSRTASGKIGAQARSDASDRFNQVVKFFQDAGWSASQAIGIAANIKHESGFNESAVGDNGAAYGIAQWHQDRQEAFKKFLGRDIKGSSFEDQLRFMQYELTQGQERYAGEKLRMAANARDAAAAVSRYYERPRDTHGEAARRGQTAVELSQKTEIVVNGAKDPHETARIVAREQAQVNQSLARNIRGAVIA